MADGTNIGNAYLQIVPSAKGMQGALTTQMNNEAGNAGTSVGNTLASKIKGALVTAGIGATLGKTIKAALSEGANLEQSLGGVEAIFGDAADKVKEYAKNSWADVGVSANQYMEGVTSFSAALIRDMGGDTEKAAEIANQAFIDMGDNANRFGKSIDEVQNVYQGLARGQYMLLDNLNLGFAGTKKGAEEMLAYASELSGQEYSIDSLADLYQAIHVVQEELNVTGTTAKEATTTLSGSFGMLKSAWSDLLGNMAIGEDISAPLQNLSTSISTYLGNLIPMIANVITELPGALFDIVSTLAPQLLQTGAEAMKSIGLGLGRQVPEVIKTGLTALTKFSATLRSNFGVFVTAGLELIKSLVRGIVAAIPDIIAMAPQIISNFAGLVNDNVPKIWEAGKEIVKSLWEGIKSAFTAIKENWREILGSLMDLWEAINWINLGKNLITSIGNGIKNVAPKIPQALKDIGSKAWTAFKGIKWLEVGKSVISFISSGIRGLFSAIPNALRSIGSSALSAFRNINWGQLGSSIISGIVSGITGAAGALFSKMRNLASDALGTAKKALGINSPSKVFANVVGRAIPEGIAYGIEKNTDYATDAVADMTGDLTRGVNPNVLLTASGNATSNIGNTNGDGNVINIYSTVNGAEDPEEYGRRLVSAAMLELRAQ